MEACGGVGAAPPLQPPPVAYPRLLARPPLPHPRPPLPQRSRAPLPLGWGWGGALGPHRPHPLAHLGNPQSLRLPQGARLSRPVPRLLPRPLPHSIQPLLLHRGAHLVGGGQRLAPPHPPQLVFPAQLHLRAHAALPPVQPCFQPLAPRAPPRLAVLHPRHRSRGGVQLGSQRPLLCGARRVSLPPPLRVGLLHGGGAVPPLCPPHPLFKAVTPLRPHGMVQPQHPPPSLPSLQPPPRRPPRPPSTQPAPPCCAPVAPHGR